MAPLLETDVELVRCDREDVADERQRKGSSWKVVPGVDIGQEEEEEDRKNGPKTDQERVHGDERKDVHWLGRVK